MLSSKRECLNHLLVLGLTMLQHVIDCYTGFYNEHRPHQGIGNRIPDEYYGTDIRQGGVVPCSLRSVVRKDLLGGLLKSYSRIAA